MLLRDAGSGACTISVLCAHRALVGATGWEGRLLADGSGGPAYQPSDELLDKYFESFKHWSTISVALAVVVLVVFRDSGAKGSG